MSYLHYPEIFTAILYPYYTKASGSQRCSTDYSFFMRKNEKSKSILYNSKK